MLSFMDQDMILHGPFDPEIHKQAFVNYLEIIIRKDGTVEYAVPSHQEKLISVAMSDTGKSRREIFDMCPPEYYFDVIKWLCSLTGCLAVWNSCFVGTPNAAQCRALRSLRHHGLYLGGNL